MKWCVIGAGGIADRRFIPALLEDKDAVLVAVMRQKEAFPKRPRLREPRHNAP